MVNRIIKAMSQVLPSPPSTRFQWRKHVNPYDLLPANPVVYDIGAKEARGCYAFGAPPPGAKLLCIDVEAGPGVDVVADAHDLSMIPDNSADCVIAVGMLLHCRKPPQVLAEFHRILKPGGIVCVVAPFVSPHPGFPPVFHFFSVEGLEAVGESFEKLDSGFNRGPASTMSYLSLYFLSLSLSFNSKRLFAVNRYVLSWLLFWTKYLDVILARFELARIFYSESYFIGRKPQ
jgi:SAM-dependent methyltransferase